MEQTVIRIKKGVASIPNACTVCWDGSGYDSTQHTKCFNNIDDVFYDTKSEVMFDAMATKEPRMRGNVRKY